jgi:hypothetical protein
MPSGQFRRDVADYALGQRETLLTREMELGSPCDDCPGNEAWRDEDIRERLDCGDCPVGVEAAARRQAG